MSDDLLGAVATDYALAAPRCVARIGPRVLRVATATGELAVKLFAPDDAPRAQVEAELLAHLDAPDPRFRVQRLVRTVHGDPLARGALGPVVVTRWEAGHFKRYTEIVDVEWHALGRSLGALHERLDTFTGELPRASERIAARDLAGERAAIEAHRGLARAKDPGRAEAIGRYLDAQLALLAERFERVRRLPAVPELPIHDDYNQHNYLFDERLPPIILDWEGAIAAPREYDVVRCLNHLPLVAPTHATAFVEGYRTLRAFDPDALRWAVDAALVDHAQKRWPLERWLAGEPDAEVYLSGSMEVLHALHAGAPQLEAFFARAVAP